MSLFLNAFQPGHMGSQMGYMVYRYRPLPPPSILVLLFQILLSGIDYLRCGAFTFLVFGAHWKLSLNLRCLQGSTFYTTTWESAPLTHPCIRPCVLTAPPLHPEWFSRLFLYVPWSLVDLWSLFEMPVGSYVEYENCWLGCV